MSLPQFLSKLGTVILNMGKNMPLAISIGLLAGSWAFFALTFPEIGDITIYSWPAFITWALFFCSGANNEGALKTTVSTVWGLLWGVASSYLGASLLGPIVGAPLGLAIAICFLAGAIIIMMNEIPILSFGAGAFPAWASYFGTNLDLVGTALALFIGIILGMVSVRLPVLFAGKSGGETEADV